MDIHEISAVKVSPDGEGYTEAQRQEFERIARQMIEWLNENCNPHTSVIITPVNAELVSGEMAFVTHDYLKD